MKIQKIMLACSLLALAGCRQADVATDASSPLHLLQPAYRTPYGAPSPDSISEALGRVLAFVERETPTQVVDARTGRPVALQDIDDHSCLQRGAFRLTSYEWGVTYAGMLRAAEATGDERYAAYAIRRLSFLQEVAPHFRRRLQQTGVSEPQLRPLLAHKALDDAGAMCAAFIKASMLPGAPDYGDIIRSYMSWIMDGQLRLSDGTLARNRPHRHTLWLDDMFMSIPAIAWMGRYTGDAKYYDEAVRQIRQFAARMFVPEKGLFMHGWVEGMEEHPAFFWARANGWAVMTLVEALEAIPPTHEGYGEVMTLLKRHIRGIAALQSGEGLWRQLLDCNDSYLETSATAIYVYAIARAINNGWVDAKAYAPRVLLAWNALSRQINGQGQVMGVCVGTGMAFDPAFYCYRPVNVFAAHGYGVILLAGAETIDLLKKAHLKENDSALHLYGKEVTATTPIFEEE
ncbi:MAG: glycoside hydrolase family 88 protein [Prevotellaceae bacterium]|jgi:rhamnogalacturonyl hydrolase YesR|nr:glycoside hydrolase family 88 protein [Prevotellaceae bacterium]